MFGIGHAHHQGPIFPKVLWGLKLGLPTSYCAKQTMHQLMEFKKSSVSIMFEISGKLFLCEEHQFLF